MTIFGGAAAIVARRERKNKGKKGTPLAYYLLRSLVTTDELVDLEIYAQEDGSLVVCRESDNQEGKYAFLETTHGKVVYLTAEEVNTTLHRPRKDT